MGKHEKATRQRCGSRPPAQPHTEWLTRCAQRLLSLSPRLRPIEAVRQAMTLFPDSRHRNPEEVAETLSPQALDGGGSGH